MTESGRKGLIDYYALYDSIVKKRSEPRREANKFDKDKAVIPRAFGMGADLRAPLHLDNPGARIWGHFEVFWHVLGRFCSFWGCFGVRF